MISIVILIVSTILCITLGAFVYIRNSKQTVNRIFGVLAMSIACLSVANYFSNQIDNKLLFIRLVVVLATISASCLYYLMIFIGDPSNKLNKLQIVGIYMTIVVAVLDLTPLVFKGLSTGINPLPEAAFGALFFAADLVLFFTLGLVTLIKYVIRRKGPERSQFIYILLGLIPVFLFSPITGIVMPLVFKNASLIPLTPVYAVILVGMLGLAIIKYKLFDIKLIAVRSIAYILTLLSIGLVFTFGAFALTTMLFGSVNLNALDTRIVYALLAILLAGLYPKLKVDFDKITNKLFFRDAYDVQTFLDSFNKILVSTFELTPLLRKISELIEVTLKPSYCLFGIKEDATSPQRILGTKNHPLFSTEEIDYVRSQTPHMHRKLIVTDLLENRYLDLQKLLQQRNVSIIARMATSLNEEGIGYLVMGPKKSGNMYSSQDIKVLEIVANELVVAIQNALHTEEIENFNLSLQEKIQSATRRLRTTNEKLRALDEAKDDFVSMASHQLRTPLTSVKGNISLVLDGDAGKITSLQRQLLDQAFTSSQRMVYLIADLLNVSRLKTGKFIIEPIEVDLSTVIEEEINQLIDTAKSRHLTLNYQKPDNIVALMLDETKTRQVIMNFVDNAIYYTPPGGDIEVVLSETKTSVECRVIDNGIGVPKAEQYHLFTKFYRAANARKARPDGTGLGLFMAKKVIIAEGGAIIFETQEGKGSTFGFSFPKSLSVTKIQSTEESTNPQPVVQL